MVFTFVKPLVCSFLFKKLTVFSSSCRLSHTDRKFQKLGGNMQMILFTISISVKGVPRSLSCFSSASIAVMCCITSGPGLNCN